MCLRVWIGMGDLRLGVDDGKKEGFFVGGKTGGKEDGCCFVGDEE